MEELNILLKGDITNLLRFICVKLSTSDSKVSFRLEDQYFIKEFIGNSMAYRLYINNNPTKIFLNEKILNSISSLEELYDLIDLCFKSIY